MGSRLTVTLPSAAAVISLPLMIWANYNEQVIVSMGMGWDTGAPIWPYETPQILLYALNFPAHIAAQPIANFFGLIAPIHYWVIFPATLPWWWFLASQLDFVLLSSDQPIERPGFSIFVLIVLLGWTALHHDESESFVTKQYVFEQQWIAGCHAKGWRFDWRWT